MGGYVFVRINVYICLWTTSGHQLKSNCHQTSSVIPLTMRDKVIKFWKVKVGRGGMRSTERPSSFFMCHTALCKCQLLSNLLVFNLTNWNYSLTFHFCSWQTKTWGNGVKITSTNSAAIYPCTNRMTSTSRTISEKCNIYCTVF